MTAGAHVYRHYALLVENMQASISHLRATASLDFRPPARIPFEVAGHGERYQEEIHACFSADGLVELIEASDRGPCARTVGYGMHHYCARVADLTEAIAAEIVAGNEVEWELSYAGQLVAVFFKGSPALPGRLEFVSADAPPLFELFTVPN